MGMPEMVEQIALDRLARKITVNRDCSIEDRQHLSMLLEIDGAFQWLSPQDVIDAVDVIHYETCEKVGGNIRQRAESIAREHPRWHEPDKVARVFVRVGELLEA